MPSERATTGAKRAIWVVALLVLVAGLGGLGFEGLRWAGVLRRPVPTPACIEPTLTLGDANYTIRSLQRDADGGVTTADESPGVVYWIEGTLVHYWFALSPRPENLALLDALAPGDPAVITWADCATDVYQVESASTGAPDLAALAEQSVGGLSVFVPAGVSEGRYVRAVRPGALVGEATMPSDATKPTTGDANGEPEGEAEILADMSFGEMVFSEDGQTFTIAVTLTNVGSRAFVLTVDDLAMYPVEDGPPTAPLGVEPALPRELAPGDEATFQITFPRPETKVVLFQVLDMLFEQYY